jgi:hypothetical protein
VRSEVVSVKRGRRRRPRVLCSAFTTLHAGGGRRVFVLSSTHRFPVFEQIEIKGPLAWGIEKFGIKESPGPSVSTTLNNHQFRERTVRTGGCIWVCEFFFLSLRIMMIYNNNNKPRYFYFLITMVINFDTQIDTRKGEQSDTNWTGICIWVSIYSHQDFTCY